MFENSAVPFTIIKEKSENAVGNQHNQYKWKKTQLSQEKLSYVIENITLVQEPTETLNLNVTFSQVKSECKVECRINCPRCGVKTAAQGQKFNCPSCSTNYYSSSQMNSTLEPKCDCTNYKDSIVYDLKIDFLNYSHEFSSNYSYEVMCRLPRWQLPDAYLFLCVERRSEKTITFKKCYASTTYGSEFKISGNTNLYFGIRRLDNRKSEMNTSLSLSSIPTIQNSMHCSGNACKVILKAKNGQITVHKSVLAHYSEVFQATFAHEMKEKQEGVVKITNFDFKVIQKMVDYLYTGSLGNVTDMVKDLSKLAHQYQLHELCRCCEEYYIFNFNINNDHIVEILELVDLYELKELKSSAEKFVQRYEKNVCTLPSYQKYMCQSMSIVKAVNYLILADRYNMKDVKACALHFINLNYYKMIESSDFLNLFQANPLLMREIYVYSSKLNA